MIPLFCFVVILFGFFHSSRMFEQFCHSRCQRVLFALESLQSGYTCETSVTLSCPQASKLVIIEVSYSSECPSIVETPHGGAIYSPSHCLGYDRDRIASICNGKRICTIDHRLEHRPNFNVGKQSNCAFKGQSFNVEYSCVPGRFLLVCLLNEKKKIDLSFRILFEQIASNRYLFFTIVERSNGRFSSHTQLSQWLSK